MDEPSSSIPLSAQFAEILVSDLEAFVTELESLNSPETASLIASARRRMKDEGVIEKIDSQAQSLGKMVAVDGGNNVLSLGSGSQCFILAVAYSLKKGDHPVFKMQRIHFESGEPSGMMYGVRNAMELALISETRESESFCIVDNSWVSVLQTINRTIDHYRDASEHDRDILQPYLEKMLFDQGWFITALQNPHNIAMSKSGVSQYYTKKYTDYKLSLADKSFLLGILEPGEYTKPDAIKLQVDGSLNVHPDPIFKTKGEVKDIYNSTLATAREHGLCLTYFRPHLWSPIKRIEFHRKLLQGDGKLFQSMLHTVAESMRTPTIMEPLEQFLVDEVVKRHTGKLPGVYQTAGIANLKSFSGQFAMQLTRRMRT
jgi:hypothetical protein